MFVMQVVYIQAPLYLQEEQTTCFFVMEINSNKVPWNDNLVTIYRSVLKQKDTICIYFQKANKSMSYPEE